MTVDIIHLDDTGFPRWPETCHIPICALQSKGLGVTCDPTPEPSFVVHPV